MFEKARLYLFIFVDKETLVRRIYAVRSSYLYVTEKHGILPLCLYTVYKSYVANPRTKEVVLFMPRRAVIDDVRVM